MSISTHSLTKRLTASDTLSIQVFNISTHSLTKRLTQASSHAEAAANYFNSQPHEEADGGCYVDQFLVFIFQLTASRRG